MIIKQIFFFIYLFSYVQTSSIINIVFTVKNLSTNDRLKLNFLTMITSLFQHTSMNDIRINVIGDSDSQLFVDQVLQNLNYNHQVFQFSFFSFSYKSKTSLLRLINLMSMI